MHCLGPLRTTHGEEDEFNVSNANELKISPVGLDATGQRILQVVLTLLRDEEGIHCALLGNDDASGHLVIVDMDSPGGRAAFAGLSAGQVKLLLGGPPASGRNIVSLGKPVHVNALRDMLVRICRRMQVQLDASLHDLEAPPAAAAPDATESAHDERSDLLTLLCEARRHGTLLALAVDDEDLLLVNGATRAFAAVAGDAESRLFAAAPDRLASRPLDEAAFETLTRNRTLGALDNLLWQCAVHAEPDRLPAGIGDETPIRLKAWPNFTRQGFRNDYFRIAAALARQPASCAQLVELTGLERRSVVGFITACDAVGLLVALPPAGADPEKVTPLHNATTPERRGLLARLAQRLGLAQA